MGSLSVGDDSSSKAGRSRGVVFLILTTSGLLTVKGSTLAENGSRKLNSGNKPKRSVAGSVLSPTELKGEQDQTSPRRSASAGCEAKGWEFKSPHWASSTEAGLDDLEGPLPALKF